MSANKVSTRPDTLVLGLEHFIDKIGYQAAEYKEQGIAARYLVLDKSGVSLEKAAVFGADVRVAASSAGARVAQTFFALIRMRPRFVELYDIGRLTPVYALLAKMMGVKLIIILRGAELWGEERGRRAGRFRLEGLKLALRLADRIVAKEENIWNQLPSVGVRMEKVHFLGNAVPLPRAAPAGYEERPIDILFLNSVKRWRNVHVLLRALAELKREGVSFRAVIAGFTTFDQNAYKIEPSAEEEALRLVDELGLRGDVELKGFVQNAANYHSAAKIFALPADIIYANYALLESMGAGAVPVVADGEGATRIVSHNVNGLVLPKDPAQWAEAMLRVLNSPQRWAELSARARETIEKEFSIRAWVQEMKQIRAAVEPR